MNLKKLTPELVTALKEANFADEPKPIQSKSVPQIKSGADLFIVSPEGSGKTTAIVIGVIQRLKAQFEVAPRAIIMVATKEKVFEFEKQFDLLSKHTDLITFGVFDQGDMQYHKDMLFEGLDVLIGTPKRLNELAKVNAIRLTQCKMFVVDDVDSFRQDKYDQIYMMAERFSKSQLIMVANSWNKNFPKLSERILKSPRIIKA